MSTILHVEAIVAPGGKIEFSSPDLPPGKVAKITVVIEDDTHSTPKEVLDWDTASAEEMASFLRASRVERENDISL